MKLMLLSAVVLLLALLSTARAALPELDPAGDGAVWQLLRHAAGGSRALVVHADPQEPWARLWGRGADVYPQAIAASGPDCIITADYGFLPPGSYAPLAASVARFSGSGNPLWQREISWADYSIRLRALATDGSGRIYATGQAWKYDDLPGPEGFLPLRGYVFSCALSPEGELLWASRWSSDYLAFESGLDIAVDGNTICVLADYSGPLSASAVAPLLLWYSAVDGSLLASRVWSIPGEDVFPRSLAVDGSGLLCVAADHPQYLAGIEQERELILLWFSGPAGFLFANGVYGRGAALLTAWDVAAADGEFFVCGSLATIPFPPDPQWLDHHVSMPLLLHFVGYYPQAGLLVDDASGTYEDAWLASVAAASTGEVWLSGVLRETPERELDFRDYSTGNWYSGQGLLQLSAWEALGCGASSLLISDAATEGLDSTQLLEFADAEQLYLAALDFSVIAHIPDALLEASTLSGRVPLTISFDASGSTIEDGSIVSYEFRIYDQGQGFSSTTGPLPTPFHEHSFSQAGRYSVIVRLVSDDGSQGYASLELNLS
ncbi:MAG: PKD domain-containing protein [bacterium]